MKIGIESNIVRYILRNAYFFNGTAYAGKSTMARLLAEKHGGILCGENYHFELMDAADPVHQPNLCYMQTMSGWQEFISRTPEEYDAWIKGCSEEAAGLEIALLIQKAASGKKLFVDTNIPIAILREISDYDHIAFMVSPTSMSVERFFDREDEEKRFILDRINEAPDPAAAMENYRRCLALINSAENYAEYANSGFYTHVRDDNSTIEGTLAELERHFKLV